MLLGFLTLYGYFLLLSLFGPVMFTYELVRYRMHLRYQLAAAWAFFSIPIVLTIFAIDPIFRFSGLPTEWASAILYIVLDGPFVLWLILRLRRPQILADGDTKT